MIDDLCGVSRYSHLYRLSGLSSLCAFVLCCLAPLFHPKKVYGSGTYRRGFDVVEYTNDK